MAVTKMTFNTIQLVLELVIILPELAFNKKYIQNIFTVNNIVKLKVVLKELLKTRVEKYSKDRSQEKRRLIEILDYLSTTILTYFDSQRNNTYESSIKRIASKAQVGLSETIT